MVKGSRVFGRRSVNVDRDNAVKLLGEGGGVVLAESAIGVVDEDTLTNSEN